MYLKTIEVHGFKSFANKIVFEFHNGITGIVGPNGSGKSNVADAVRWVLGEQRVKQLRGASMQDIIFSGTETRKPLSYAYVAITLDNMDRSLGLDYNEITIARRVYRSGESEYLINGTVCRLKDVNELFYDTGIGKEGYSIIGQGQIDKILNGKPEERRELFDEAAGIVKYKRRKAATLKKLENERQNLVRVNDILEELEKQVGPLKRQSEQARIYLKKKEELKNFDINLFLIESKQMKAQMEELEEKIKTADRNFKESNASYEGVKERYNQMEQELDQISETMDEIRENVSKTSNEEGKLTGEINVLKEQIHSDEEKKNQLEKRKLNSIKEKEEKEASKSKYEQEIKILEEQLFNVQQKKKKILEEQDRIKETVNQFEYQIEEGKSELIQLLNHNASTKANRQRYDTMLEQTTIRKAQLNQMIITHKSEEEEFLLNTEAAKEQYDQAKVELNRLIEQETTLEEKRRHLKEKKEEYSKQLDHDTISYHKEATRLESLKNIAERYDGYGSSIRRVMERRDKEPNILGVVADLIKVEKKYETAIETALGGSIQNIVTEDEDTAKRLIQMLKENKYGRATFLPLTSMKRNHYTINEKALQELGVIGMADQLVKADIKYREMLTHLLGRTYIVDTIDHAIRLARTFHYSLRIVTLEGESLNPGGSMTGGAFKNTSNLLGRKREIEDLKAGVKTRKTSIEEGKKRLEEITTAQALLMEELEQVRVDLQRAMVVQNTAKLHEERVKEQKDENEARYQKLKKEALEIEHQILDINESKQKINLIIDESKEREGEIEKDNTRYQTELKQMQELALQVQNQISEIGLEEAKYISNVKFIKENMERLDNEIRKCLDELSTFEEETKQLNLDKQQKAETITNMEETLTQNISRLAKLNDSLKHHQEKRSQMSLDSRQYLKKREELSEQINLLDKELFRLNNQSENIKEAIQTQDNYMWEEYELTYHNALTLRDTTYDNLIELKKLITTIKEEIRSLGAVNVNAIEDYKNLMDRYTFLKSQHEDLIEAEKTLIELIEELDEGMRTQFTEKFALIKREFDKAFRELFGGGKGTLELVEDEDILECGIKIIAQPPGKKLQNMMQLSGGEKALTAISLLFAIQNLKPSPFCLLDEIEAALDDSNVGRFAAYLHKLTKNTQFIIITHRRGTMSAADRLYGITMQEKGVSTLVSVNLIEEELNN